MWTPLTFWQYIKHLVTSFGYGYSVKIYNTHSSNAMKCKVIKSHSRWTKESANKELHSNILVWLALELHFIQMNNIQNKTSLPPVKFVSGTREKIVRNWSSNSSEQISTAFSLLLFEHLQNVRKHTPFKKNKQHNIQGNLPYKNNPTSHISFRQQTHEATTDSC